MTIAIREVSVLYLPLFIILSRVTTIKNLFSHIRSDYPIIERLALYFLGVWTRIAYKSIESTEIATLGKYSEITEALLPPVLIEQFL